MIVCRIGIVDFHCIPLQIDSEQIQIVLSLTQEDSINCLLTTAFAYNTDFNRATFNRVEKLYIRGNRKYLNPYISKATIIYLQFQRIMINLQFKKIIIQIIILYMFGKCIRIYSWHNLVC